MPQLHLVTAHRSIQRSDAPTPIYCGHDADQANQAGEQARRSGDYALVDTYSPSSPITRYADPARLEKIAAKEAEEQSELFAAEAEAAAKQAAADAQAEAERAKVAEEKAKEAEKAAKAEAAAAEDEIAKKTAAPESAEGQEAETESPAPPETTERRDDTFRAPSKKGAKK